MVIPGTYLSLGLWVYFLSSPLLGGASAPRIKRALATSENVRASTYVAREPATARQSR